MTGEASMLDPPNGFKAIIRDRLIQTLTAIIFLFGIATEAVVLYGQSREAAIKAETAKNAMAIFRSGCPRRRKDRALLCRPGLPS